MDRRDFLKRSAWGIAGAIVGGSVIAGLGATTTACTTAKTKKRIGLQLYSLRDAMRENPRATLEAVAAMGYSELETADYNNGKVYGMSPTEFRALVEGLGMTVSSCHIGRGWNPEQEAEIMAWWEQALVDHKDMGCKYVIVPAIHIGETLAEMDTLCGYFNRLAEMAKTHGLKFGYHNHSFEMGSVEGHVILDYMIENTTPDVVYEMDMYWVIEGGASPVEYLNKYAGRFPLLHIKDVDIIGASGTVDFEPIFNAAYAQGMENFYVEVEQYPLPAEVCVQKSYDFLEVAPYVK